MAKKRATANSNKEPPDTPNDKVNAMLPGRNGKYAEYFLSHAKKEVDGTPWDRTAPEAFVTQDKEVCAAGSLCKCGNMPLVTRHRCMVCAFCLHTECGTELKETSQVKIPSTSVNQVCNACATRFSLSKLIVKGELSLGLYSLHRFKRPKYPEVKLLTPSSDDEKGKPAKDKTVTEDMSTNDKSACPNDVENKAREEPDKPKEKSSAPVPMEVDKNNKKDKVTDSDKMEIEDDENKDKASDDETVNGDNRSENPSNSKKGSKKTTKVNTPPTYMDLHLMIPKVNDKASPAEIIECLRDRLSSWLTGVQSLEQSFKLHTVDPDNQVQSVVHSPSEFPKTLSEIKDFFKGVRPIPKGGKVFMKIKASFEGSAHTILSGTDWYHKNNNEVFRVSDLQSCHNDTVGWLLYSLRSMDINLLSTILERRIGFPLALRWRRINDGSQWVSGRDTRNDPRAVHIECASIHAPNVEHELKDIYKTKAEKFPLHIRLRFVPSVSKLLDIESIAKFKVLANRQAGWVRQHMARSREDIVEIDRVCPDSQHTLRDLIMKISTKTSNLPLFASIDRKWNGVGYNFSFHPSKQEEATTAIRGLYPRLAHHFGEKTISSFFTPLAVKEGKKMKYDPETNAVTSEADEIIGDIAGADPDMDIVEIVFQQTLEGHRNEIFEKERGTDDSVSTFNTKRSHPTEIDTQSKKQKTTDKDENSSTSSITTKHTLDTRLTSLEANVKGVEKRIEQKIDSKFNEFIRTFQASLPQQTPNVTPLKRPHNQDNSKGLASPTDDTTETPGHDPGESS